MTQAVEAATRRLNEETINDDALLGNDVDNEKGTHFVGLYHYFWKSDDRWVNRSTGLVKHWQWEFRRTLSLNNSDVSVVG